MAGFNLAKKVIMWLMKEHPLDVGKDMNETAQRFECLFLRLGLNKQEVPMYIDDLKVRLNNDCYGNKRYQIKDLNSGDTLNVVIDPTGSLVFGTADSDSFFSRIEKLN